MRTVLRYLRLLRIQARAATLLALQYRVDFLVGTVMALFWTATALVPLAVLFRSRSGVAGWSWPEALVVVGFFTLLKGVLQGSMQPSLTSVVEHVRRGTLDFLLLKPADAQFMVSTSRFELARAADVLGGMALIAYGVARSGGTVTAGHLAVSAVMLVSSIAILYSIWILAVSLAFHVVKVDNLAHLISSTYDAARWPASVFRGFLAFLFTFIIPLALMTTYPSLALLGRITLAEVLASLAAAAAFLLISRLAWLSSIAKYTSAGG